MVQPGWTSPRSSSGDLAAPAMVSSDTVVASRTATADWRRGIVCTRVRSSVRRSSFFVYRMQSRFSRSAVMHVVVGNESLEFCGRPSGAEVSWLYQLRFVLDPCDGIQSGGDIVLPSIAGSVFGRKSGRCHAVAVYCRQ